MEAQTPYPLAPEETVIRIMRRLSPERVAELVDFARFLDLRTTERFQAWQEAESEHDDQASATEVRWDQLFARPKAKELMRQMAREAREDFHAGRTTEITDTEDGRLAPGRCTSGLHPVSCVTPVLFALPFVEFTGRYWVALVAGGMLRF